MYKLGTVKFEGLKGFASFESTLEANYVQHALIDGKPRLQRVGTNLEEINATVRLHSRFCTPETELFNLYQMLEGSQKQALTNKAGDYFGDFVLASVTRTLNRTTASGRIIECEVAIRLLEAINPNDAIKNRSESFALGRIPGAPIPVPFTNPIGDANLAGSLISAVASDSQAVSGLVQEVGVNVGTADVNLKSASNRLDRINGSLDTLSTIINNTQSRIYTAANQLRSHMSVVQGALGVLKNACDTVDTVGVDAANRTYQASIVQFRTYSSPIAVLAAIRD